MEQRLPHILAPRPMAEAHQIGVKALRERRAVAAVMEHKPIGQQWPRIVEEDRMRHNGHMAPLDVCGELEHRLVLVQAGRRASVEEAEVDGVVCPRPLAAP
eukprot:scaffold240674_cov31-Tisochrysis_lutea.AAC.1